MFKTLEPFMKNNQEIKHEIKFRVSIQFKSKTLHYGLHDGLFIKTDMFSGCKQTKYPVFTKWAPKNAPMSSMFRTGPVLLCRPCDLK